MYNVYLKKSSGFWFYLKDGLLTITEIKTDSIAFRINTSSILICDLFFCHAVLRFGESTSQ